MPTDGKPPFPTAAGASASLPSQASSHGKSPAVKENKTVSFLSASLMFFRKGRALSLDTMTDTQPQLSCHPI